MKKLLLNFIASVFCFFLAVVMVLASEYTDATDNLTVEWLGGDGTDIYNLTGDNVVAIRSERGHATVNITGAGSRVVDNCSDDGCPTQYFNGQFADTFSGADGTTLAQHYPPWYGVRYPSGASNCVITSGAVACTPVLGTEMATNGDFSSATGWTVTGAEITGGQLVFDNDNSYSGAYRSVGALTEGTFYLGGGTIVSITTGNYVIKLGVGLPLFLVTNSLTGPIRGIQRVLSGSSLLQAYTATNSSTAILDDVTSKQIIWSTFLSNLTDYKFKTELVYSIDMTVADGDIAGIAFKVGDTTAGSEDFCLAYLNKGTGKVELMKVVAGAVTTPVSGAVTYVAGATLKLISADGIKWIVVYNDSQVGTEQTLSEASLDSSVAGFFATSASTTFDNWKAGRWQLGSELVTNGDGERLTGWVTSERGDTSSVAAGGAIGNCFQVMDSADAEPYIYRILTLEQGKQYCVSYRHKIGATSGLKQRLGITSFSFATWYANPSGGTYDATGAAWEKTEKVLTTTPTEADVVGYVQPRHNGAATTFVYFDEISIREIQ